MVREAVRDMLPELTVIWQQSFGDSEAYIKMFFEWNFDASRTIICETDGHPLSAAYLLPAEYVMADGRAFDIFYLYAAATRADSRGRGYFSSILRWIEENIAEPVLLVPANGHLMKYYAENGFRQWLEGDVRRYKKKPGNLSGRVFPVDAEEYGAYREQRLKKNGYVRWNPHFLKYIIHENEICGGSCRKIVTGRDEYAAICRKNGDVLEILEILSSDGLLENGIGSLLEENGCTEARVCISPCVMATAGFPVGRNQGYFNLTLG